MGGGDVRVVGFVGKWGVVSFVLCSYYLKIEWVFQRKHIPPGVCFTVIGVGVGVGVGVGTG